MVNSLYTLAAAQTVFITSPYAGRNVVVSGRAASGVVRFNLRWCLDLSTIHAILRNDRGGHAVPVAPCLISGRRFAIMRIDDFNVAKLTCNLIRNWHAPGIGVSFVR